MVALPQGSFFFGSLNRPRYISGALYRPDGYNGNTSTTTTTATRVYYFPIAISDPHTFQGASVYNSETIDNGEKVRLMVFNDDLSTGGPGTLAKDFGEITLTGVSALRTLSSSWTANRGMYWGAVWAQSSSGFYSMTTATAITNVGFNVGPSFSSMIGVIGTPATTTSFVSGHYVDTTYGAAPATAVAPTATIETTATTGVGIIPSFWLVA